MCTEHRRRDGLAIRGWTIAPAFIGYNLGVGLVFLVYSLTAGRPLPVAWLVAAAHLLAGIVFAMIVAREPVTAVR